MNEGQFKNLKQKLTLLVDESILFKMLPEKRSEFKNAITSTEHSKESEQLIEKIIKFFEEEHDAVAQATESFKEDKSSQSI